MPCWPPGTLAVSLEGVDGSGKSTILPILAGLLRSRGSSVLSVGEFGGPLGVALRTSLTDLPPLARAYAFAAERHWWLQRIEAEPPDVVIWDRYVDSAVACRSAEISMGVADPSVTGVVLEINARLPQPHQTALISLPVEVALIRASRREESCGRMGPSPAFLTEQDRRFRELAAVHTGRFIVVNGLNEPAKMASEIVRRLMDPRVDGSLIR